MGKHARTTSTGTAALGWDPIGGTFTGTFEGNTFTISNLYIDRSGANTVQYAGLFGQLGSAAEIRNLKLKGVDVTVATNAGAAANPGAVYAGGIAGDSAGDIISSYVIGDVTAEQSDLTTASLTEGAAYAGGLVGNNTGNISASFARGEVLAEQKSTTASLSTYAGGLVGYHNTGAITASYAAVDAEAKTTATAATATLTAGGLVGHTAGGSVVASYSTGIPSTTGGASPTANKGGLIGSNSGTVTNSYWDTSTSGITATGAGTGKTTSQLQTPTAYGSSPSIYANWNVRRGRRYPGNDDPWDFGTANQYPTLDYGELTADDQRPTLTLSVNPSTIWESNTGGSTRATSSTLTATLSAEWSEDVTVTLPTNTAYTLSVATITISAGSTSGTATLTAVNNFTDAANNIVTLTQAAHPTDTTWVSKGTDTNITINDDDELTKPTGVKLSC